VLAAAVALRYLGGFPDRAALGLDHFREFIPRFYGRFGAFILKLSGQCVDIDSSLGELGKYRFAIPPSAGRIEPSSVCSARAFKVPSGIVFTVKGAARALT